MTRKIFRGGIALLWTIVSIVQFTHHDIVMGVLYAAVAVVFLISIFKNKQN